MLGHAHGKYGLSACNLNDIMESKNETQDLSNK